VETRSPMDKLDFPESLRNRYRPERLVGEGGMGRVYLAEDKRLKRPVAVKVIQPGVISADVVLRFTREARALADVGHPALVRILDAELAGESPAIVMEWLDGASVASLLRNGPMEPAVALSVLRTVLEGLNHIHSHGMLHRDIKPSNIFLRESGEAVLIDFGLTMRTDETRITQPGGILGTMRYLAPELLQGGDVGVSTDLFALGLTTLEMLACVDIHATDLKPGAMDMARIGNSLVSGSYYHEATRVLRAHGALGRCLLKALAPEVQDRFASAAVMLKELHEIGAVEKAAEGHQPASGTPTRIFSMPARERPAWWMAILLAVFTIGWFLTRPVVVKNNQMLEIRPTFTAPGEMEIVLPDLPAGTRLEFLGMGALPRRPGEKPPVTRFDRVPAGRVGRINVITPSHSDYIGPEIRTPELIQARNFICVPLDDSLLVDFELSPPVGAAVQLLRTGQEVLRRELKPGQVRYRERIGKLVPSTWYDLEVIPRTGWGGVNRWTVQTLQVEHPQRLALTIRQLPMGGPTTAAALGYITTYPDPRVVPPLKHFFETLDPGLTGMVDRTPWVAEALRSTELVDGMLVARERSPAPRFDASVLRAAARIRHPRAAQLGLEALRANRLRSRPAALEAVACPEAASGFDFIRGFMESRPHERVGCRQALRAMDRARARVCFGEWAWLATERADWRPWAGAVGLAELGEQQDVNELLSIVEKGQARVCRGAAALAVSRFPDPRIQTTLVAALAKDPQSRGLMVAATRVLARGAAPILRQALKADKPQAVAGAVMCLAAFEDDGDTLLFRSLLCHSEAVVRAAAARALGSRRDVGSKEVFLAALRAHDDPEGSMSWALARLRSPEGYDVLVAELRRLLRAMELKDESTASLLSLALGEQGNAAVAGFLREVARHPSCGPYTYDAARYTANRLKTQGTSTVLLLPNALPMPQHIHVMAGDVVTATCHGLPRVPWVQPDPDDPSKSGPVSPTLLIGSKVYQVGHSTIKVIAPVDADIWLDTGMDWEGDLVQHKWPEYRLGFAWISVTVDRRIRSSR
jgi:hypothetical protein